MKTEIYIVTNNDEDLIIAFEDKQECIDYCAEHWDVGWVELLLVKGKQEARTIRDNQPHK